jgi:hypothetical protein
MTIILNCAFIAADAIVVVVKVHRSLPQIECLATEIGASDYCNELRKRLCCRAHIPRH